MKDARYWVVLLPSVIFLRSLLLLLLLNAAVAAFELGRLYSQRCPGGHERVRSGADNGRGGGGGDLDRGREANGCSSGGKAQGIEHVERWQSRLSTSEPQP